MTVRRRHDELGDDEGRGEDAHTSAAFSASPGPVIPNGIRLENDAESPRTVTSGDEVHIMGSSPSPSASATPETTEILLPEIAHRTLHAWIGVSLILGFILMYLLDTLSSLTSRRPPHQHHQTYDLSNISNPPPPPASFLIPHRLPLHHSRSLHPLHRRRHRTRRIVHLAFHHGSQPDYFLCNHGT